MVRRPARSGFTLVELVIFIVVSTFGLVGILALYQVAVAKSADVLVARQAQDAAYSLLEEIQAMSFTYCDLSDPAVTTASSAAGCSTAQGLTPSSGQGRGSLSAPFENVGDYGGYSATGITDINGNAIAGLSNYRIAVALSQPALTGVGAGDAIRIDITVTGPLGAQTITGYRLRHSPNATP